VSTTPSSPPALGPLLLAFKEIDLNRRLAYAPDQDYLDVARALPDVADEARKSNEQHHVQVLRILEKICMTRMELDNPNNPFEHDFSDFDIEFMANIVDSIDNPLLGGRLADVVWNSPMYRSGKNALAAIDNYMRVPLRSDSWYAVGYLCWNRAISLCKLIGKGAGERLSIIECSILKALEGTTEQQGFFGHALAKTLLDHGLASASPSRVAEKLESLAREFNRIKNYHSSGRYFNASAEWFTLSELDEKAWSMIVAEAKAFELEAETRVQSDNPSHSVAASFLKNALQIYLTIPRKHRGRHNVDQVIQELKNRIGSYGKLALDEMATYTTPGVDVSNYVRMARNFVSGRPAFEALLRFANIHTVSIEDLREMALEGISRHPLQHIFPVVYYSNDGRVVETTSNASDKENEPKVNAEINRIYYGTQILIATRSLILPALEVLDSEHTLNLEYFIELARRSSVVPRGREMLWGLALHKGFNRDFITSIHLLAPQIEHMVRFHLKSRGVVTSHTDFDSGGIEFEKSLGFLMDLPETETIFGKDLTFEMRALFCDPVGPNLRNNVAHGLLDDEQLFTMDSIYAWWFGLKLTVLEHQPTADSPDPNLSTTNEADHDVNSQ